MQPRQKRVNVHAELGQLLDQRIQRRPAPGLERDINLGLGTRRTVTYERLPFGAQRFEVRTIGANGQRSEPASVSLDVVPPLWRRAWFLALLALAFVAIALLLHRARVAHLLRRFTFGASAEELERRIDEMCARLLANPVIERYSALWIWMGEPERADAGKIPDFSFNDPDHWAVGTGHMVVERYGMSETLMLTSNPYIGIATRDRIAGSVGRVAVRWRERSRHFRVRSCPQFVQFHARGVVQTDGLRCWDGYRQRRYPGCHSDHR